MCGIVGAVAERQVQNILLLGLQRLEYRGYDSAGMAVIDSSGALHRNRTLGKVAELEEANKASPLRGTTGIAHTRWATHGQPSESNAHPHQSGDRYALVHNGIIENHESLREALKADGFEFTSETDTETIVHLVAREREKTGSLIDAVKATIAQLDGAYGLAVIDREAPHEIAIARSGSPLVIGVGIEEHFVASDVLALRPVTDRFRILEEGDVALVRQFDVEVWDVDGNPVDRPITHVQVASDDVDKGNYRHHMQKEIFEQPDVVRATLDGRLEADAVIDDAFGAGAEEIFAQTKSVTIVACGTSYYAGLIAGYWIEEIAGLPCNVEIASEFRYRTIAVQPGSLFVTLSQSGETADTLAALRLAKTIGYAASLTICNVPTSSIVRESDLALMIEAGAEVGVASTKAFTGQLTDLFMLTLALARHAGRLPDASEHIQALKSLPVVLEEVLQHDDEIRRLAERFIDKQHALFLGRGQHYPIALEGALKLKEISYIHAEGYPAGELKHGPLALVDEDMPVIAVAPDDALVEKLKSNLEEVRARGGELIVFAAEGAAMSASDVAYLLNIPATHPLLAPIVFVVPLQLLAYHVAVQKGTDVDQPRNLAKSVTVE